MAMGGSHHKGNSNGSRSSGMPYGLMLLLAFGAALLGVMVLHKLRERRIFSLLVQEKETQLISVQLLFQKEREYGKEMKRKNEEIKEKLYSLRTQKMELDRKLLEMQSTIDSLKDEQKAIESAMEEKQNEIKMQREHVDASNKSSQLIVDIKEILKRKEAEIEDLRLRIEYPVKVWSVSKDDQSNPYVNLTNTSNVVEKYKSDTSSSKEAGGELPKHAKFVDGENSTRVDDRSEKSVGDTYSREITVEHLGNPEISQVEKGIDNSNGERKNITNSREGIVDDQGTDLKPREYSSDVKDGIEPTITRERELENLEISHEDEKQEVRVTSNGGMKLEMLDSSTRSRGKHGHMNRIKGNRWRTIAKNRVSENNAVAGMRSRSVGQASKSNGKETGENLQEVRKTVDAKLPKASPEDPEHMEKRDENADPNQQLQQENEMSKKFQNSPDRELHMDRRVNDAASNISTCAEKQVSNEVKQPEEEANGIQQVKVADKRQLTDDIEATDVQESETGATNGGSKEESASKSNLEEDKEEYKETYEF